MILGPAPSFARVNRFFGPLRLAAMAADGVAISAEGRRWHRAKLPFPAGMSLTDLEFAGGRLWVFGKRNSPAETGACVTENGEDWQYVPISSDGSLLLGAATLASGVNVVVGEKTGAGRVLSAAGLAGFVSRAFDGAVPYFAAATARSNLVAILGVNRVIYTTPDSITVTARTVDLGASGNAEFIKYRPELNRFIAGTSAGNLVTSEDGLAYTPRASGAANARRFGGAAGKYLIGGLGGNLRGSSDLITWSAIASKPAEFTQNVAGIGVANDNLIVAGAAGSFLTSGDGSNFQTLATNWPFDNVYRLVSNA